MKEFLEEALVMKGFNHPHVLTLYGVVIRELKPQVVLEYMNKGDLKTYVSVKAMVRRLTSKFVHINLFISMFILPNQLIPTY